MRLIIVCALFFLFGNEAVNCQTIDSLFSSDPTVDAARQGELAVEIDNLTFFKDNEFNSSFQEGYTLPGFWLQLKAAYQPLPNLRLEAGAHSLWFWGTNRYPAYAYRGLATWNGKENAHNVHVLPVLRANIAVSRKLNFVMGNIYGGTNHGLIEPLYNPELNLSSDPETGTQLLFNSRFLDFDMWLDWQSFIFKNDTHHESFLYGISAKIKANDENSSFHVYFPLQNLIQHRGGEIDTMGGVFTTMNSSIGAGVRYNINHKILKNITLEADLTFNKNPEDSDIPVTGGRGYYGKLAFQLKNFNISTSYWKSDDFISMYGNPFYGSLSFKNAGMYFEHQSMLHLLAQYVYPIGKGFDLGVNGDIFYFLTGYLYAPETDTKRYFEFENNRNYSLGIYLRITPAFLLK
ncbi:MAG: hypothetical protein LBE91_07880 [Tannerella sp.]|nr:hypothetical protein [Tannerella sp.]